MKRLVLALSLLLVCLTAGATNYSASTFTPMLSASASSSSLVYWPGGIGVFTADGTWSGATVTLEFKAPDGTMIAAGASTTLTTNGAGVFYLPACSIEAVISNAGGSTSLTVSTGAVQQ